MDGALQIRDYFYAGFNNYCLKTYEHLGEEEKMQAAEYIYQIYMINNMNNNLILNLRNSKEENLYLLYLYYKYYYLDEKEDVLTEIKKIRTSSTNGTILKSRILFDHDLMDECFDLLNDDNIEIKAAKFFFLFSINRNDLVKEMIDDYLKMNDEIPIIKIVLAIFYLYNDNNKESFLIFDDLESLYTSVVNDISAVILNGKGVSNILNYEFNDAKEILKNSMKSKICNADIIFNLVTCSLYLFELDEANEYLNQLYNFYPSHDSLTVLKKIDHEVDNFVAEF
ncbi:coatomer subunit epsilon, putative [Plasmodium malariae]|uniref:Coatomer subunit epsilon, putative n=1 Tax=Plasmodium malariae TaxID=5858 RepID=A0A1C3KLA1_PLAMA|nr:coatomer subunit epsilon, putative [Plasmodium malariae]